MAIAPIETVMIAPTIATRMVPRPSPKNGEFPNRAQMGRPRTPRGLPCAPALSYDTGTVRSMRSGCPPSRAMNANQSGRNRRDEPVDHGTGNGIAAVLDPPGDDGGLLATDLRARRRRRRSAATDLRALGGPQAAQRAVGR